MTMSPLLLALDEVFAQGEILLSALTDESYVQKIPEAQNSSIGAHYRHSLEHCQAVLDNLAQPEVDYDARARSVPLETDRRFALEKTRTYRADLQKIHPDELSQGMRARCQASYSLAESTVCASTVEREMLFVVSHAIHHYALISLLCSWQKIRVPPGFGVAPSTLKHRETKA